jgi:hypothetical protein
VIDGLYPLPNEDGAFPPRTFDPAVGGPDHAGTAKGLQDPVPSEEPTPSHNRLHQETRGSRSPATQTSGKTPCPVRRPTDAISLLDPDPEERERDTDALARFVSRRLLPGQSAQQAWGQAAADAGDGVSFQLIEPAPPQSAPSDTVRSRAARERKQRKAAGGGL